MMKMKAAPMVKKVLLVLLLALFGASAVVAVVVEESGPGHIDVEQIFPVRADNRFQYPAKFACGVLGYEALHYGPLGPGLYNTAINVANLSVRRELELEFRIIVTGYYGLQGRRDPGFPPRSFDLLEGDEIDCGDIFEVLNEGIDNDADADTSTYFVKGFVVLKPTRRMDGAVTAVYTYNPLILGIRR